jgi:hypothetical protein
MKNTAYGEPTAVMMIGATMTLKATPSQFVQVAGATRFGGII